jgi:hypothetical protein
MNRYRYLLIHLPTGKVTERLFETYVKAPEFYAVLCNWNRQSQGTWAYAPVG